MLKKLIYCCHILINMTSSVIYDRIIKQNSKRPGRVGGAHFFRFYSQNVTIRASKMLE